MIAAAGIKPSEMIARWAEEQAFLARAVDRIPYAMRLHHYRCLQRVEKLIAQHRIVTTVPRLTSAYRQLSKKSLYGAGALGDLGARPLGILFLTHGDEEITAPLGLLLAVHDLVAAVDRIVQFDATKYLSPAVHRQLNAKRQARPAERPDQRS
ncbi:hypothetical protein H0I39_19760 [Ottowia beijingensis]|uniref:Uncharacterized protein n=1 Tax=Ottowia beijingensis TaxID=1207057 RepID=A0A853IZK8_9BURK|nr:hypothetical protein [Ottowia beijingensis]NZA03387.1 hypothetical protein [Ottowia beijingensis]